MKKMAAIVAVFALVLLGSLTFLSMAQAEEVGHFSQVVNQVDRLKQGKGPPQPAKVKDGVENQDMVRTADQSRAMMRFIDDTTMTVGPKSELTIEEYMYDASKGRRQAVVKLLSGVVETVAPQVASPGKSDFTLRTPTATAGIRGTKYITVVGPNFTMFYVLSGTIRVKSYSPDLGPTSPAMKCISDQLKRKVPIKDIIEHCLDAGLDPCTLIKAAVIQGISLEELGKALSDRFVYDPQLKQIFMKCAVEALRAIKEEDVGAGKYALSLTNMAPIIGNLTAGDLAQIASIMEKGVPADLSTLPGYVEGMISVGLATPDIIPPTISPTVPPSFSGQTQTIERPPPVSNDQ